MKQSYLNKTAFRLLKTGFTLCLSFCLLTSYGQLPAVRQYASRQHDFSGGIGLLGSTSNLPAAADNDPATSANLTLGVGVGAWRELALDFNTPTSTGTYADSIPAGTPITIKFSLPAGLAGALGNIEIQAITHLQQTDALLDIWAYDTVGAVYTDASLAGLLSGNGSMEYTITPASAYQGIRIRFGGLASVASGINVYDAYINIAAPGNIVCSEAIDELDGVRAGTVVGGLLNATGGVSNPLLAIDGDNSTYAQLNTGAQVLSDIYLSAIFNTPSKIGDSVVFLIQDPGAGLLDLTLLSGVTVNLYNGSSDTPVQTFTTASSLLSLSLLDGTASNVTKLAFAPDSVFDRAEISFTGTVTALQSLRVYEIYRQDAGVALTAAQSALYAYAGTTVPLNATTIAMGDSAVFFDAPTGGNMAGDSIVTTSAQAGTTISYYAGAMRNGCSEITNLRQVNIEVIAVSADTPGPGAVLVPYNGSVAITAGPNNLPLEPAFKYTVSGTLPAGLVLSASTGQLSGIPTVVGTFPLAIQVTDTANNLQAGTFNYDLVINSEPLAIQLVSFSVRAEGLAAILNWETASNEELQSFDIERSPDASHFEKIGNIAAGNSGMLDYSFKDILPTQGWNYYRLGMHEMDGTTKFSEVIKINVATGSDITLYPNPADNYIRINAMHDISQVQVYNIAGKKIDIPLSAKSGYYELNTGSLPLGLYTVRFACSGNTIEKSFLITR